MIHISQLCSPGRLRRALAAGLLALSGTGFLLGTPGCNTTQGGGGYAAQAKAMSELAQTPLDERPWEWGYAPGVAINTAHYRIYTTLRDPLYQRLVARTLEAAYARAAKLRPGSKVPGGLECYVFGDRPQWELYTRRRAGSNAPVYLQISAGGYCQEGVFAGYDIGRAQTLSVIAHEAWHQYSWYAFKDRLPSWLEEGLATQNEAIEWDSATPTFVPHMNDRRFSALRMAMRENRLWRLQDLASTHAGRVVKLSDKHVAAYYAQLWSLVLFLEHSKHRPQLLRILQDAENGTLAKGLSGTGLSQREIDGFTEKWNSVAGPLYLRKYFAQDLGAFEEEYHAFLRDFTSTWPPKLPAKR